MTVKKYLWSAMPMLKDIIANPQSGSDDDIDSQVEKVVKLLKFIMRILQAEFLPFVDDLFSTVLASFQKSPICSLIYLVEVSITVFRNIPNGLNIIVPIY